MIRDIAMFAGVVLWAAAHLMLFLAEVALRGSERLAAGVEGWMARLDGGKPRLHPREAMLAQEIARIVELDARIEAMYAQPKKARLRRRPR